MHDCIINPSRRRVEPRLPACGVLAVNPSEIGKMRELASYHHLRQEKLFHSNLYSSDRLFLAGPAVGAPMAVMTLEKLIALGAQNIIVYGWCGALVSPIKAGDIVIPTWALSEEGTSAHYAPVDAEISADPVMRSAVLAALQAGDATTRQGPIWTTDAVFRETREKIAEYGQRGLIAVDMEYSALCTVARFRGVRLAAVMLTSDELYHQQWRPQFGNKAFRNQSKQLLTTLCEMISSGELSGT